MARVRITSNKKKEKPQSQKIQENNLEWDSSFDCAETFQWFLLRQNEKGNSLATVDFYERFMKKFEKFLLQQFPNYELSDIPIEILQEKFTKPLFVEYMENEGLNQQTINAYLRGYRAFGNWAEEEGYIKDFKCSIKEIEPPVKDVYTTEEMDKLLIKPPIDSFAEFRSYCVISLILSTGIRLGSILEIKLKDVNLGEGYVYINKTKTNKTVSLPLEKRTKKDLTEWIKYWRIDKEAGPEDYLFCNEYGEQLSKSTLCQSIARYNRKRGVTKTSIHLFRHTFGKQWIVSGGDIITLAKILTHSELDMVKRYSNLYSTDLKREVDEHSARAQIKTRTGKTIRRK